MTGSFESSGSEPDRYGALCQDSRVAKSATQRPTRGEKRRAAIERGAVDEFLAHGIAGASMARIAEAAGISRPALYQYYRDKEELFAASLVAVTEQRVDAAIAELTKPGTVAEQLDRFLQRYEGDLWQQMSASDHTEEIINAKSPDMRVAMAGTLDRLRIALDVYFGSVCPGDSALRQAQRASWIDLLGMAPRGFWHDEPSVTVFRRRLTTLAYTIAAAAAPADQVNS
ncbi:MAG: TetR/AcrR family transcriptional regulator [Acidimicrobiales bacterium]|nr:TetR/AcrR family transcriptional regulator [Acidimicrobiales bacterium]MYG88934.1 TetR/AcrR family transcriptional regulator [Acidimicrobiales bacterium]MYI28600.1 TetR/AcrR family transcriptional regulator [Acidimicrobiales bacterium]